MKTDLEHLPEERQKEIKEIVSVLHKSLHAEMIILFGSFARGDWVDEQYREKGTTFEYKSDYDLLVVLDNEEQARKKETEKRWKYKLRRDSIKETPLNLIFHGNEYLNKEIEDGNYFFMDVIKDGVILYDSGKHKLASPVPLNKVQRKNKAETYFAKWFENANEFYDDFERNYNLKRYNQAAFMLHQSAERYYMTILLVYTDYKPKFHDLEKLDKMVCQLDDRFRTVFQSKVTEGGHLFDLLKKAYIDSRYKLDYIVTDKDLDWLSERVKELRKLAEEGCNDMIKSI
ncbi:MAG: hypothetical protein A2W91_01505 [Bacteroidetes bacterium GWF2_38_335]|nr:MAG: hypothetical protein A2W91_01505 [Bacteroidetes bacterium GWF2_38_335]OFY78751.1 MAG: hypothetical protein A2281_19080 [Bacteroidetes bacterium RIFOXYA12_FULL_38_20]HBS85139.1 hypothetical protein [Bacteroidales bacterium]